MSESYDAAAMLVRRCWFGDAFCDDAAGWVDWEGIGRAHGGSMSDGERALVNAAHALWNGIDGVFGQPSASLGNLLAHLDAESVCAVLEAVKVKQGVNGCGPEVRDRATLEAVLRVINDAEDEIGPMTDRVLDIVESALGEKRGAPTDHDGTLLDVLTAGLVYDGEHHKQWALEEVARSLGIEVEGDYEHGIAP